MSKDFDKLDKKLNRQFGKDRNMAMATSIEDVPSVRIVDTYYLNNSFYIATHESSEKTFDSGRVQSANDAFQRPHRYCASSGSAG